MTDINAQALDRELKRGTAELLILSLLDARPRHGYELSKLIHMRSGGQIQLHIDSAPPFNDSCLICLRNHKCSWANDNGVAILPDRCRLVRVNMCTSYALGDFKVISN